MSKPVKTCSKSDQSVSEQTKAISLFSHGYLLLHRPTSSFSSLIQEDDDDGDDDDCHDDDCDDDDCDDPMMIAMIANHDANEYIFQTPCNRSVKRFLTVQESPDMI